MTTWFTSDLHFGHLRILEFCPERPGDAVGEMGRALIENILSDVKEGDTLFVLGDATMGDRNIELKWYTEIRDAGVTLVLISGNHDYCHPAGHKAWEEWDRVYRVFFDAVYTEYIFNVEDHLPGGVGTYTLSHFPVKLDAHDAKRYNKEQLEYFTPFEGAYVILHGHSHSSNWKTSEREIHVGIDADWTEFGVQRHHPIPLEAILAATETLR